MAGSPVVICVVLEGKTVCLFFAVKLDKQGLGR